MWADQSFLQLAYVKEADFIHKNSDSCSKIDDGKDCEVSVFVLATMMKTMLFLIGTKENLFFKAAKENDMKPLKRLIGENINQLLKGMLEYCWLFFDVLLNKPGICSAMQNAPA